MKKLSKYLYDTLVLIDKHLKHSIKKNSNITITNKKPFLKVTKTSFESIDKMLVTNLTQYPSSLSDAFVDFKLLENFLKTISSEIKVIYLNHIGFCYRVRSKRSERKRLLSCAKSNNLNLYEIPSNDPALWLFIGSKDNIYDPKLEFLPVENADDYYEDYWLPHVHIDLDLNIKIEKIKALTHTKFNGTRTANPSVTICNKIYQVRIWIGVISGVNICLDVTTDKCDSSKERSRYQLGRIVTYA